ncbi:MAG: hypothetical protein M1820_000549 [Bogoriella megaspora]|nr:MAG: hypothetical protein M1820_000549 [Bogoriella megaspora]
MPAIRTICRWRPIIDYRRTLSSAPSSRRPLQLPDVNVIPFRRLAFEAGIPASFPQGSFQHISAANKWFEKGNEDDTATGQQLNTGYLQQYNETMVPLELTTTEQTDLGAKDTFERFQAPLQVFIDWCTTQYQRSEPHSKNPLHRNLYLAQASLSELPQALRDDLPTPEIVCFAGRGDIYDANIWMGLAPTYTPLHKDPNPNLFVQLAGRKLVRLFEPAIGLEIFRAAQARSQGSGSATFRGTEMMEGEEKAALEDIVWGENAKIQVEASLEPGDALFIPKGWWHSIRGVGSGITASVSLGSVL